MLKLFSLENQLFVSFLGELWNGYFWDYGYGGEKFDRIQTRDFKCLSVQGRYVEIEIS